MPGVLVVAALAGAIVLAALGVAGGVALVRRGHSTAIAVGVAVLAIGAALWLVFISPAYFD